MQETRKIVLTKRERKSRQDKTRPPRELSRYNHEKEIIRAKILSGLGHLDVVDLERLG
jgi:hypothetical protein